MNLVFRDMMEEDIPQVNAIYNEAIQLGYATAHLTALPEENHMQWLKEHNLQNNPIIVVCEGNKILGWNSLSNYRSGREGLSSVRETSYYIHKEYRNKGLATMLMNRMIERAKSLGIRTLVTFIMEGNQVSIRLMENFGFELWGQLPGIISNPQGYFDHMIFGKKI